MNGRNLSVAQQNPSLLYLETVAIRHLERLGFYPSGATVLNENTVRCAVEHCLSATRCFDL